MKRKLKALLMSAGIYEYIKYSTVFTIYERIFKPEVQINHNKEVDFYQSFLKKCPLIFDVGAYDGHKTAAFLHFAEKVVCCEPDIKNFKTLQIRFRKKKSVKCENIALASSIGTQQMHVHHKGSAFNTINKKFKTVLEADNLEKWNEKIAFTYTTSISVTTLDQLIEKYGKPYFIKIDVEGYELEVIKGLSTPIPFISLECLLPEFKDELKQNIELLRKLDPDVEFNIAINEKLLYKNFLSYSSLIEFIESFNQNHFELIVKMEH